ncbi:rCG33016, partial [Rattus norvegicus]
MISFFFLPRKVKKKKKKKSQNSRGNRTADITTVLLHSSHSPPFMND